MLRWMEASCAITEILVRLMHLMCSAQTLHILLCSRNDRPCEMPVASEVPFPSSGRHGATAGQEDSHCTAMPTSASLTPCKLQHIDRCSYLSEKMSSSADTHADHMMRSQRLHYVNCLQLPNAVMCVFHGWPSGSLSSSREVPLVGLHVNT